MTNDELKNVEKTYPYVSIRNSSFVIRHFAVIAYSSVRFMMYSTPFAATGVL